MARNEPWAKSFVDFIIRQARQRAGLNRLHRTQDEDEPDPKRLVCHREKSKGERALERKR